MPPPKGAASFSAVSKSIAVSSQKAAYTLWAQLYPCSNNSLALFAWLSITNLPILKDYSVLIYILHCTGFPGCVNMLFLSLCYKSKNHRDSLSNELGGSNMKMVPDFISGSEAVWNVNAAIKPDKRN
jgi:hypothetical protein